MYSLCHLSYLILIKIDEFKIIPLTISLSYKSFIF